MAVHCNTFCSLEDCREHVTWNRARPRPFQQIPGIRQYTLLLESYPIVHGDIYSRLERVD